MDGSAVQIAVASLPVCLSCSYVTLQPLPETDHLTNTVIIKGDKL